MIQTVRVRAIAVAGLAIGAAMFLTVLVANSPAGSPDVFLTIADQLVSGLAPYRDFPLEYPPLALLPLALPRFLAIGSTGAYQAVFIAVSVAQTVAMGAALCWLANRGWSATSRAATLIAFFSLVLAAAPQVLWRFDIFPALLSILAVVAVASRRPAWAGALLGLGTMAKLYPAFLLPVLLAYYVVGRRWREASMVLVGFAIVVIALVAQVVLVAGVDAFSFLAYQGERGVEIESVIGGLVMLAHNLLGTDAVVSFGFGSYQVESSFIHATAVPGFIAQVALGLALAVGLIVSFMGDQRTSGQVQPRTLITYLLATLLLVMLANKVLSPQYICWLLPFGALLPWRQSLLLVVICALTTFVYPLSFDGLLAADPLAVAALNLRNLLLLVLLGWLILPARDRLKQCQIVARFEKPPSRPAPTPNMNSPIASRCRFGAIRIISAAANPTVITLASVSPGRPIAALRLTTIGFASADIP